MNTKSKQKQQATKPQPYIRQLGIYASGFWTTPVLISKQRDLTPTEKDILSILIGLHMGKAQYEIKDGVTPSQAYLAEQTGCTITYISKALKRLEKKGYIAIEQRGLNMPNIYRLLLI